MPIMLETVEMPIDGVGPIWSSNMTLLPTTKLLACCVIIVVEFVPLS